MRHLHCHLALTVSALLLASCAATTSVSTLPGADASIPRFESDDPRVETAGFVAQTLRLSKDVADAKFTLMSFVVGETATLGAMVKGPFNGRVRWNVGERRYSFPMDTAGSLTSIAVEDESGARSDELVGNGAGFRGTYWVNVEVPASCVEDGTPLQLTFQPEAGSEVIVLPDTGFHYVTRLVDM